MTGHNSDDDRAVSPVIGVILMVAITVILAAVIGTFVLNLGGSIEEDLQAGASIQKTDGDQVRVTWTSNQNADRIELELSGDCSETTSLTQVGQTWTSTNCASGDTVQITVTATDTSGEKRTVVTTQELEL